MGIIKSGSSTDQLNIDPTNKSARISLYDTNNNNISNRQTFIACTAHSPGHTVSVGSSLPFFLSIFGSATKTIHVLRIQLEVLKTVSANLILLASKRSSPNTGGNANNPLLTDITNMSVDSKNRITTANVKLYNNAGVSLTPGTLVGVIETRRVLAQNSGSLSANEVIFDFTDPSSLSYNLATLRGTSEGIDISYAVAPGADTFISAEIEWTEE